MPRPECNGEDLSAGCDTGITATAKAVSDAGVGSVCTEASDAKMLFTGLEGSAHKVS